MPRKIFVMTPEQWDKIVEASKPIVKYMSSKTIILEEVAKPMLQRSQIERANAVWKELAEEMGFIWDTVRPMGQNQLEFTAEVRPEPPEVAKA